MSEELCFKTAVELAALLRSRAVSAEEVMHAHLRQIERVNPTVNAIVTLDVERALAGARAADRALAGGEPPGVLHGLPIAHKDLLPTRGMRTTFGSPIYRDFVPDADALLAERLRNAGAICIGKTNTPEFGAGSQTFNTVFGATRNPWDPSRTCGGSSGGAAVALACGMLPIADGSDLGGSLRNPASFCNVVGLRPSPGRVPSWPTLNAWFTLAVLGPMARTVQDVALMMQAIVGPDVRIPFSSPETGRHFARPLAREFKGVRVAWSRDLGGLPFEPAVVRALEPGRRVLQALGCEVEEAEPDLRAADRVFRVLRAWHFEAAYGTLLDTQRAQLKDTVVWNIEEGRRLSGHDVARAEIERTELHHRIGTFMEQYEFLAAPVVQVPPFDVNRPWVTEIDGQPMQTYLDWMKSCYLISATGLPALSIPCGFTEEGLPVGLQLIARHQDDFGLLQLAYAFQEQTGTWKQRAPLVA
ncbi:MAG: amidase [Burkholderiales bacterium]|nr:amidase [Burkholderiales bacterium]